VLLSHWRNSWRESREWICPEGNLHRKYAGRVNDNSWQENAGSTLIVCRIIIVVTILAVSIVAQGEAPPSEWRMQVVDRTAEDPRTEVCPAQVRYVWEGTPAVGQRHHSTQVFCLHSTQKASHVSTNPGAKGVDRSDEFAKLAGASGIQVVRDDCEVTALHLEVDPGRVEWVVFNPGEMYLEVVGKRIRSAYEYINS